MKHLQRELEALSTMTTNETGNPAAIATSLTAGEREALKLANKSSQEHFELLSRNFTLIDLEKKGLVTLIVNAYELTDLGKRVLEALETPAAADARPPVISAKDFVEQGYKSLIDEGKCKVTHKFPTETFIVSAVFESHFRTPNSLWVEYADAPDDPCMICDNERLQVTWLPTATAQPAPDNGGGDVVDWQARALKAEADLASVYSTAKHMNSEAHDNYTAIWKLVTSNIGDWDYPAQVIRHVGHMVDDLAAANADLAAARERLAVVEAERDAALEKADNLQNQMKMVDHMADVHEEQYKQEKDNATMLYKALVRNTPPEVYKPVIEGLFQSTNEYDKLMSEGSRWKEKHQRATWKIEELEAELAASALAQDAAEGEG